MNLSSPATLQTTPSQDIISNESMIFDVLSDPRKEISEIESFVQADPLCLGAISAQSGYTPLHEAARRGDSQLIRFFVENGAVVEVKGHLGETPFFMACNVSY